MVKNAVSRIVYKKKKTEIKISDFIIAFPL